MGIDDLNRGEHNDKNIWRRAVTYVKDIFGNLEREGEYGAQEIHTEIANMQYTLLQSGNEESDYVLFHLHGNKGDMTNFLPQMCNGPLCALTQIAPNRCNDLIDAQNIEDREKIIAYLHPLIAQYITNGKKIFLHGEGSGCVIAQSYVDKYPENIKAIIACSADGQNVDTKHIPIHTLLSTDRMPKTEKGIKDYNGLLKAHINQLLISHKQ